MIGFVFGLHLKVSQSLKYLLNIRFLLEKKAALAAFFVSIVRSLFF